MFPVFSLVLDKDVKSEVAMLYPELYKDLLKVPRPPSRLPFLFLHSLPPCLRGRGMGAFFGVEGVGLCRNDQCRLPTVCVSEESPGLLCSHQRPAVLLEVSLALHLLRGRDFLSARGGFLYCCFCFVCTSPEP